MDLKRALFWLVTLLSIFYLPMSVARSVPATAKISANLIDIKTRDLLKLLTEHANKSVIISEKITGKVTVDLRELSWREALDAVLQMQGLVKQETAKVMIIVPVEELSKNDSLISSPKIFNLRYLSADGVAKLLKPAGILSTQGRSGVEAKTNSLVVVDTDERINSIAQLLKEIDRPAKQVLIEARIVSADENFMHELGVEFGSSQVNSQATSNNSSSSANPHPPHNQFNFAVTKLGNNAWLDLELAALESEGRGKVISKPKLLTTDRQVAYIEAGAKIPYQEKTKGGSTSVAFKKAVLSLKVTPEVTATDTINLSLELNQDKVGQLTVNGVPTIDTRKIHTQVLVRNNETVVLGGIYEWSKSTSVAGVPLLSKIPLVKLFFSKKLVKLERKELLIFVTPKIVLSN